MMRALFKALSPQRPLVLLSCVATAMPLLAGIDLDERATGPLQAACILRSGPKSNHRVNDPFSTAANDDREAGCS